MPNNVDVAAQVVRLVRERQRKLDMADGCIDEQNTPAAAISSNTCCERGPRRCLQVDARIQEQRDAKSRNQQPRRVSPEMASKPRDMCHGALLSQCPLLTW